MEATLSNLDGENTDYSPPKNGIQLLYILFCLSKNTYVQKQHRMNDQLLDICKLREQVFIA